MKRSFILCLFLLMGTVSFAYSATTIDENIVRSFKASFPDAREVIWHEYTELFTVHFVEDGVRTRISYWKNGQGVEFIRNYQERNLPAFIRYIVKKTYPDQTIFGVVEVSTVSVNSNITYYVKLEDAKTWFTLKVDSEGNSRITEKYRKR